MGAYHEVSNYRQKTRSRDFFVENQKKFNMKLIFIFVFISMGLSADAAPKKHHRAADGNILDRIYESIQSLEKDLMWRLPLPVRLVDKDVVSKTRGRLEVFADGKWGTVCDDGPNGVGDQGNNNVAVVVCRMMGLSGGQVIVNNQNTEFGAVDESVPVLWDDMECNGDEESVFDCKYRVRAKGASKVGCGHGEDLGITCS